MHTCSVLYEIHSYEMLHEKLINVGNQKLKIVIHKTAAIPEVSSYEKNHIQGHPEIR